MIRRTRVHYQNHHLRHSHYSFSIYYRPIKLDTYLPIQPGKISASWFTSVMLASIRKVIAVSNFHFLHWVTIYSILPCQDYIEVIIIIGSCWFATMPFNSSHIVFLSSKYEGHIAVNKKSCCILILILPWMHWADLILYRSAVEDPIVSIPFFF